MKLDIKKIIAVLAVAFSLVLAFSSCQLSELGKDGKDKTPGETTGDTGANKTPVDSNKTVEDYLLEGIDLDYVMDYMNEDLSAYVPLGEYKGISVEAETYEVDKEYIDGQIKLLLESMKAPEKIMDRKTQDGDVIYVDYSGSLDGVAFAGGTAKNVRIYLEENNSYIPGFVDGMYDRMPGETVSYPVTFPEVYQNNPDLAGKETIFTVTVHYIEGEDVVPELNDAFVKENFGSADCNTVDDFMKYYADLLEKQRLDELKQKAFSDVWTVIMESATTIALPEKSVQTMYWMNRANYEYEAARYGMEYEQFLEQYGASDKALLEFAESYVKEDIVIYSIVKAEGLELTDKEISDGITELAAQYGMEEEAFIEKYTMKRIVNVLQWEKLVDAVYSWSDVSVTVK